MAAQTVVFVVLDPTCMEQAAQQAGEVLVQAYKMHRGIDARLHLYCCVNGESVSVVPTSDGGDAKTATVDRVAQWLERLAAHPRAEGMSVETEAEWHHDWRHAIVKAAKRQNSSIVVKNMTQHSRFVRMIRETSDWTLIRECECPMLLVKTGKPFRLRNLLVAVKHDPDNTTYEQANDNILASAKRMAGDLGGELHAVTCYEPGRHPDRQRFADRCGLARNQVSAAQGAPEKVIAEAAQTHGSDLLIIARVARPENPNAVGKTARKVIDEIDSEVLVLPVS